MHMDLHSPQENSFRILVVIISWHLNISSLHQFDIVGRKESGVATTCAPPPALVDLQKTQGSQKALFMTYYLVDSLALGSDQYHLPPWCANPKLTLHNY